MEGLIQFLSVVFLAIFIAPFISSRLRIPLVVSEMLIGIILGNLIFQNSFSHLTEIMEFFKHFGLIFLMFFAGLEIDFEGIEVGWGKTALISVASLLMPFGFGYLFGLKTGINPLFMGTLLSTTSLGVILPLSREISDESFRKLLLGSVVLVDILSMFLLALAITLIEGELSLSFLYSLLFIIILFFMPRILRKTGLLRFLDVWIDEESHFELGVRFSFALIIFFVLLSEFLGFHSIIGAFISGLIISEALPHDKTMLERKLESFGYGFFIPLFFILVGARVDLIELFSRFENLFLLLSVLILGILSKFLGAGLSSVFLGIEPKKSIALGILHSARLSLVIAAVEIGIQLKIIDESIYAIFVILAVITSILSPSLGKVLVEYQSRRTS